MGVESWCAAVLAVAVWPLVVVVIVVVVVLFAKADQQPALLSAIADLVRAARGVPASANAAPQRDPTGQQTDAAEPPVPETAGSSPGTG